MLSSVFNRLFGNKDKTEMNRLDEYERIVADKILFVFEEFTKDPSLANDVITILTKYRNEPKDCDGCRKAFATFEVLHTLEKDLS